MTTPLTSPRPTTIPSLIATQLGRDDTSAQFIERTGRAWRNVSRREVDDQVRALAAALVARDLPAKGTLAVVGRESVAGHLVALAAQCIGTGAFLHLDVRGTAESLAAALAAADVCLVVCTDPDAATGVRGCGHHVPGGILTVDLDPESDWSSFLAAGSGIDSARVEARRAAVRSDDPAVVLIATDGRPWSLSHGAAVSVAHGFSETGIGDDDTVYVTDGVAPGVHAGIALAQLAMGFARVIPHAPGTGSELRDAKPTVLVADAREVQALHQRMLGSGPVALQGLQLERALDAATQVRQLTASGATIATTLRRRALPITEAAAFMGGRLADVRIVGEVPDSTVQFFAGLGATATPLGRLRGLVETLLEPHGVVATTPHTPISPTIPRPEQPGLTRARAVSSNDASPGRARPAPPQPGESLLEALLRRRREAPEVSEVPEVAAAAGLPLRAPVAGRSAEIRTTFSGVSDDSRSDAPAERRMRTGDRNVPN